MNKAEYHRNIIEYYTSTENAYKDSWDLNNSLSIHYGYWDKAVKSFPQSLLRMNEVMIAAAAITERNHVLDAGCGVGGSSIFMAARGTRVTGITLSERQAEQARVNAEKRGVTAKVDFQVMDYAATTFEDKSFDVVWGCESICYADDKEQFVKEAYRILKPGGRLVVADGFVTDFRSNNNPIIRKWLEGWQVNYLETPQRFQSFMENAGFTNSAYSNISAYTLRSSKRLYYFYFLSQAYLAWKKFTSTRKFTDIQKKNSLACKYQYVGMQKKLWEYGLIVGTKPA